MAKKKLCLPCYWQVMPEEPIHVVTLGRQCVRCHATTDRGELMVSVEYESVPPPLPAAS